VIRGCLKKQVPASHYDESKIFHLRGAIDYTRLSLKHRIMMKLLYSKVVNLDTLEPIVKAL
jgi:hypothetical protein